MSLRTLLAGYVPLTDCAPLVIAREMGFARDEGLDLDLRAAPSWSSLRDMLVFGQTDAAHMLSVLPVAGALGLGGLRTPLDVLSVLSANGTVIGVSRRVAASLRECGHRFDFADAAAAGRALIALGRPLRLGIPFPFSMHAELVYFWLGALGLATPQALDVRTVPPPLMAEAMGAAQIDAFCVGEPWGSEAVEAGTAELLLPGAAIWAFAPEKVLAVRGGWADAHPDTAGRLMRAVWRAGDWLSNPHNRITMTEILARSEYLDVAPEMLDRLPSGRLVIAPSGEQRGVAQGLVFGGGAANFPWRSQGAWIADRLARRNGHDAGAAMQAGAAVFRSDLYACHLAPAGARVPPAISASRARRGRMPAGRDRSPMPSSMTPGSKSPPKPPDFSARSGGAARIFSGR